MRGKNMSNEKIKDSEYYLKDISKSLDSLTKIMSCFLILNLRLLMKLM